MVRTKRLAEVQALNVTSDDLLATGGPGAFDSVVYVNVLEHIRDDGAELRTAHDLLSPGGTLAVFVPALHACTGAWTTSRATTAATCGPRSTG